MMGRVRMLVGISVFWLGLSMLFDGLNTLVLPQHLLGFIAAPAKATVLGLVTFAGLLLGMLIQPVAGVASDRLRSRWGRRGTIGLGVLLILAALAIFGFAPNLGGVIGGYLCIQAAASVAQAAEQGFIPDLIPVEWRGLASGFKNFADIGGALLAFVLLAQLLTGASITRALLAIAAVLLLTFLLTIVLVREPDQPYAPISHRTTLLDAFRLDLTRHRAFAWLVGARFLFLLGTYMVGRFLLYFIADRLNLDPGQATKAAGTVLAVLTLVTVAAALPAGWAADRFGRMPLMLAGAGLSGVGVLLLAIAGTIPFMLLAGTLMALGSAAFASANWALTVDLAPPEEAGRFLGLANIGTAGGAAVAGLFGPLIDGFNSRTPGTGYAALFIASALIFLLSALALRGPAQLPRQLVVPGQGIEHAEGGDD